MLYFDQLNTIVSGKLLHRQSNNPITHLFFDSRKAFLTDGALFIAIRGKNHDGHQYITELHQRGFRQFVIESEKALDSKVKKSSNIVVVNDAVTALQKIATNHRMQFKYPVLGITGSNGKTIIKEWLCHLLSDDYTVIRNPKSFNSQIGVPLSVWLMNPGHDLGIFEAGISLPGEMKNLEKIVKPQIGIFTNIGSAHDEGFKSLKQKVKEKAILFRNSKVVIFNSKYELLYDTLTELKGPRLISWSFGKHGTFNVKRKKEKTSTRLQIISKKKRYKFIIPFVDDASTENLVNCIIFLIHFKVDLKKIQSKLSTLAPVIMRLELKSGINNCHIVDDSYNNDLGGLEIALDFINQQSQHKKKTIILSDILQTGLAAENLFNTINQLLKNKKIDRLIGIGPDIYKHYQAFEIPGKFYRSTKSFLDAFSDMDFQNEMILIKGARIFSFEKIAKKLQQKIHQTVLEFNLGALTHNLNYYRSKLSPHTKVMVMVKAFAYGSDSYIVAKHLQFHRVDYLAVAYVDEGVALRKREIPTPIMVMNPSDESFDKIFQFGLEPEIYNFKILQSLLNYCVENKIKARIHLKLDTGMHRLGFEPREVSRLCDLLDSEWIDIKSIFSHLAGQDEEQHNEFSIEQVRIFKETADIIEKKVRCQPMRHIVNSAGIIRFPEYQFDMVRLGIGLYGVESNQLEQEQLEEVSTLKTIISQITAISKGETIGYGRAGKSDDDITIATIPIGYADGFSRGFSNGVGEVLINGHKAPVVGNVCMDMTMVDITGIPAAEGDEVIIFGNGLNVVEVAEKINTIPYEILTNVSNRVKRVFLSD